MCGYKWSVGRRDVGGEDEYFPLYDVVPFNVRLQVVCGQKGRLRGRRVLSPVRCCSV